MQTARPKKREEPRFDESVNTGLLQLLCTTAMKFPFLGSCSALLQLKFNPI